MPPSMRYALNCFFYISRQITSMLLLPMLVCMSRRRRDYQDNL